MENILSPLLVFSLIFIALISRSVFIYLQAKKSKLKQIEYTFSEIGKNGFKIMKPLSNSVTPQMSKLISNQGITESEYIYWSNIESIYLNKNKNELTIKLKDKKKYNVSEYDLSFYKFLKYSPILNEADKAYSNSLFKKVKDCEICGVVSVYEGSCLNCFEFNWEHNILDKAEETKEEYVRNLQLDHFSYDVRDNDCKIDFYMDAQPFERNPQWKPVVTQDEVLAYYKKEYGNL
jgi:hypothetical protein